MYRRALSTKNEIRKDLKAVCEALERDIKMPMLEGDALAYIELMKNKLNRNTIKRRIASLAMFARDKGYLSPATIAVQLALATLPRKPTKQRQALLADEILAVCNSLPNDLAGLRDKTIIIVGFSAGGRRRSEISAMDMEHLTKDELGYLWLLPRSKTDQQGKGFTVPIVGYAFELLQEWLKKTRIKKGAIFRTIDRWGNVGERLSSWGVGHVVCKRLEAVGYDKKHYGAHSLRAGYITYCIDQGAGVDDIKAMTAHKSTSVLMGYYRGRKGWKANKALELMQNMQNQNKTK